MRNLGLPSPVASLYAVVSNGYVMVAGICLLCFFHGLGLSPLFDLDEGAFSEATREMLERGDYVTTYLNGTPRFDKPILIYWLQAFSVSLFGLHEWALRLPSALAASLWTLAVFSFTRPRFGQTAAIAAAAMTGSALAVTVIGRAATADAVFNLLVTLSMFDAYRYIEEPRPALRNRAFIWVGLAVLTKGPIAIFIPFATSLVFFGFTREWRRWLDTVLNPVGLALCFAIFVPWYVLEYLDQGMNFINGFLLKHNVGRFSSTMEGHGGTVLYYFPAILLVLLPYSGLFLGVLLKIRRALADPFDRWVWIWFGVVFTLFSFSNTQLPHYILYGVSPLFVLIAKYRDELSSRLLAFGFPLAFFLLLLFLPELLDSQRSDINDVYTAALVERADSLLDREYRLWMLSGLILAAGLAIGRALACWRGLVIVGLWQAVLVVQVLVPLVAGVVQEPIKAAGLAARTLQQPVVMWGINTPSFSVYRQAVTERRKPRSGEIVFTRIDRLSKLGPHQILSTHDGVVLARLE